MTVKTPRGLFGIEASEHYGLGVTSGSDIHGMDKLAKGGIVTEKRITTPKELVSVLRSGEYELIETY